LEFGEILEIIVLVAISIELFALYNHTKFDKRIDEHIVEADKKLEKSNEEMKILDEHAIKLDEHMSTLEIYMTTIDKRIIELNDNLKTILRKIDGKTLQHFYYHQRMSIKLFRRLDNVYAQLRLRCFHSVVLEYQSFFQFVARAIN
jgi:septal ring factor EnvC (AmiA/AmiB activator)